MIEKENRERIKRKHTHTPPDFVFGFQYLILDENKTVKLDELEMFVLF